MKDKTVSLGKSTVGKSIARYDANRLVAGAGAYLDDLQFPRLLHVAFVRSPYAHARITSLDVTPTVGMPGVVRAVTASDLDPICRPMQVTMPALNMAAGSPQHPLAANEVCWHGAPVVAVVANTRAQAEDAAEAVVVDYAELPAVTEMEQGLTPSAPSVVLDRMGNLALERTISCGDASRCVAEATTVVEQKMRFGRQAGVPLESRGIVAAYNRASGELTVHQSHQSPFQMRDVFSELLGVPPHRVRVICPDVGGAFGTKLHAYPDELAVAAIAVLLGECVKFQADRLESFLSDAHAREAACDARLALDEDGRFVAFEVSVLSGLGAYQSYPRGSVGEGLHAMQLVGAPYRFEAFKGVLRCVHQNKVPTGAYRGVGQPLACTITESLVDLAARRIAIDPAELRRRNYLARDRERQSTPAGLEIGTVSLCECLDEILQRMDYKRLREEQASLRRQGIYRGIGLATFIEMTAVGPGLYGANQLAVTAQEGCSVRLEPAGMLLCYTSATDQGQGSRTAIGQIVAETFGVSTEDVLVRVGDTASSPVGGGTWASRGLALGGESALLASQDLRRIVLEVGARVLGLAVGQVEFVSGAVRSLIDERHLTLADIATIAYFRQHQLPGGGCPELIVTRHYVPSGFQYLMANGIQASQVEVDVETGLIRALGHWVVHDCGRVVNPLLVDEQIRGGVAQGIGAALFERCEYSDSGQLSNGTLADYLLPMAGELPDIDVGHVESVAPETTLGAKGVGEAGAIGAGAAVWNAVNDALAPFDVFMAEQPFSPDRILRGLSERTGADPKALSESAAAAAPV